ncbi:hypothetical protein RRG08_019433 [Elysia crispata]|uniref:Uncharacterized protein n=1 Tax=Elysia crispata TaxID=231223 RepID=A0AAE0Z374_9GAST|nr:hypothetical protein RRG08_019433 [Elysia crispata]
MGEILSRNEKFEENPEMVRPVFVLNVLFCLVFEDMTAWCCPVATNSNKQQQTAPDSTHARNRLLLANMDHPVFCSKLLFLHL